jgi:hypothetical protein
MTNASIRVRRAPDHLASPRLQFEEERDGLRHEFPPGRQRPMTRRTFVEAHWPALVAADFFTTVDTVLSHARIHRPTPLTGSRS